MVHNGRLCRLLVEVKRKLHIARHLHTLRVAAGSRMALKTLIFDKVGVFVVGIKFRKIKLIQIMHRINPAQLLVLVLKQKGKMDDTQKGQPDKWVEFQRRGGEAGTVGDAAAAGGERFKTEKRDSDSYYWMKDAEPDVERTTHRSSLLKQEMRSNIRDKLQGSTDTKWSSTSGCAFDCVCLSIMSHYACIPARILAHSSIQIDQM